MHAKLNHLTQSFTSKSLFNSAPCVDLLQVIAGVLVQQIWWMQSAMSDALNDSKTESVF